MAMSPVWLAAAQEYLSSVALLRSSWRWCCQSSRSPSSRISSAGREQLEHESHDEWAEIVLIVPRGFPPPSSLVTLAAATVPPEAEHDLCGQTDGAPRLLAGGEGGGVAPHLPRPLPVSPVDIVDIIVDNRPS